MGLLKGSLRIHVIEAKSLLDRDSTVITKDVSDPYVTVDVGVIRVAKTFVKDNTVNPRWNELFLVEVNSKARSVTFKVKDRDYVGCDMLGWLAISVEELLEEDTISGWFPLVSLHGKHDCGRLRIELSFSQTDTAFPNNMFPMRTSSRVRLYRDACCTDFQQQPGSDLIRRKSSIQVQAGESAWIDLYQDIKHAQDLIYISGHTLNPDLRLSRYTPCETLGELLLDRADKGVQVLILVHEVIWGTPCEYDCHLHDPERHLKLRFANSPVQVVVRPAPREDHTTSFVLVDTCQENVQESQRRLATYYGGLDLVTGRWDTPSHSLFETQKSAHRGDFYNPRLRRRQRSACKICAGKAAAIPDLESSDHSGARLPWHDSTTRIEGRLAQDLLLYFEEEWLKWGDYSTEKFSFVEIDDEDYELDTDPCLEGELWEATLLRSIEQYSNPTASLKRRSARRTRTRSILQGGHSSADTIQRYIIERIRKAKKFIYVECPVMFKTKEPDGFTLNSILNEMVTRILISVENRTEFTVFFLIPELVIQTSTSKPATDHETDKLNQYHRDCISKVYSTIGSCIAKHPGSADKHPTDYAQFYTLRNSGSATPFKIKESFDIQSEMVYVHSQVVIVDDEYLVLGTPSSPQQLTFKDYETAIALNQPYHRSVINGPLPTGQVHSFRMALWLEHVGQTHSAWTDPSSPSCRDTLRDMASHNRACHESNSPCQSHLLAFCRSVQQDGKVKFYEPYKTKPVICKI